MEKTREIEDKKKTLNNVQLELKNEDIRNKMVIE
jgi:hypothetical protein